MFLLTATTTTTTTPVIVLQKDIITCYVMRCSLWPYACMVITGPYHYSLLTTTGVPVVLLLATDFGGFLLMTLIYSFRQS